MRILVSTLFIFICQLVFGQTTVKEFVGNYDDTRSFFLYQSTLRSFSDVTSDEFNKLIRDVDKISIHILPQNGVSEGEIDDLILKLENAGLKEMKSISKRAEGASFYTSTGKNSPLTVGVFYREGMAGVVQLDGEIDMKYVAALKDVNPEKVSTFFGFEQLKEEFENNRTEEENE
ncbi:MAG: DUF4252 domain-containing protein [Bacteroidia bacterium]